MIDYVNELLCVKWYICMINLDYMRNLLVTSLPFLTWYICFLFMMIVLYTRVGNIINEPVKDRVIYQQMSKIKK